MMAAGDSAKSPRQPARLYAHFYAHLYQFAIVAAILGVLAWVLLGAIERTAQSVEEAGVQSEAAALRVELLDVLAHRAAFGGQLPAGNNPVVWTGRAPAAYLGELDAAPLKGGVWYFDRPRGELVYRFRSGREARFRLVYGAGAANVAGGLGGVGLLRIGEVNANAK
jgi:hypothetical protein